MGGIVGRLFREFAVTLSMAILVSLAISLTTTPMMCALLLKPSDRTLPKRRTLFDRAQALYGRSLAWSLRHSALVMLVLLIAVVMNVVLFVIVPKGFFPQQDTGRMMGSLQADQSISFQAMQGKLTDLASIVQQERAAAAARRRPTPVRCSWRSNRWRNVTASMR
jgi:multidrug efflux pump